LPVSLGKERKEKAAVEAKRESTLAQQAALIGGVGEIGG